MKKVMIFFFFFNLLSFNALAVDIDQLTKAAYSGSVESARTLGQMYLYGEDVERDVTKGRQLLAKAVENNDAEAQFILGESYYWETMENVRYGLPNKSEQALLWLNKAFENGISEAGFHIGDIYLKRCSEDCDYDQIKQFWEVAAQAGDTSAKMNLARFDDEVAEKNNLNDLMQKADDGDALAAKELAQIYLMGRSVFPYTAEHIKWRLKAAELGDVESQRFVANGFEYGSWGLPLDYEEALYWYQTAAGQGDQMAQLRLLTAQLNGGLGVTPNPEEAAKKIIALAEDSYVDAQIELVNMYLTGNGVTQSYLEAIKWLTHLAELGNVVGPANQLGDLYFNGTGVEQNYELAMQWYLTASLQSFGGYESNYNLAEIYFNGLGVTQDYERAFDLYLKAMEFDSQHKSKSRLIDIYYYGLAGKPDYSQAFALAEELAAECDPKGYFALALMYHEGKVVVVDNVKTLIYLKKLSEIKDVPFSILDCAQVLVEQVVKEVSDEEKSKAGWNIKNINGLFVNKYNYDGLVQKASKGNTKAQTELAQRFYEGAGVEQNYSEAVKWYTKAALNNDSEAQYRLGQMYAAGKGVLINYTQAYEWYLKAAEKGNSEAQYSLSELHKNGMGVKRNLTESFNWALRAAESGLASAQYKVAIMYFYGIGTDIDHVEGYLWMVKSYENTKTCKNYFNLENIKHVLELVFPGGMTKNELIETKEILKNSNISLFERL